MTEAEIFEFDLNGYIVYKDMLTRGQVDHMNGILNEHIPDETHQFQFITLDPVFMELMAHPGTLRIIRTMIGEWMRLDHAYGIQMDRLTVERGHVKPNLHGGPRHDHGEHQYQWFDGKMYNGLIVVMYALEDINPGDGGLICVPGSHKSNFDTGRPSIPTWSRTRPLWRETCSSSRKRWSTAPPRGLPTSGGARCCTSFHPDIPPGFPPTGWTMYAPWPPPIFSATCSARRAWAGGRPWRSRTSE